MYIVDEPELNAKDYYNEEISLELQNQIYNQHL